MAGRIEGVEIFAVGRWKGNKTVDITSADLDDMISSFNDLNAAVEGFRPPLKLGHAEQQKFWGGQSGMPSLGFVEKVWRVGDKVLANFSDMPDALIDMVKQRRYNTVSIELYSTIEHAGRKFKNVLSAVALLGAELPAVKGLKELAASLFEGAPPELKLEFSEKVEMFTQEQVDSLIKAAVEKAVAAFAATQADALKALNTQVTELTAKVDTENKARVVAETALGTFKADAEKQAIVALVDKAVADGKILPKQKDEVIAMATALGGNKIKMGDSEKSGVDIVTAFIDGLPKKVEFGERGTGNRDDNRTVASDKIAAMAQAKQVADKQLSYDTAVRLVLAENPDLKAAYFAEV